MPMFREILLLKEQRLQSVPDDFAQRSEQVQKEILKELLSLVNQLEKDGDMIILSSSNLALIQQISESLLKYTFDETEYMDALIQFTREFNVQAGLSNDYMREIQDEFIEKSIYKETLRTTQEQAVELLSQSGVNQAFINPVKEILNVSVTSGSSFNDMVQALSDIVIGTKGKDGLLLHQVKQVAYDGFAFADRQYLRTITNDLGYEWFQYFGGILEDSRCFCVTHLNGYFHKSEVEYWGDTPSLWDKKVGCEKGGGRVTETNKGTIFTFAGGYRCKHQIIPVPKTRVPKEWIDRSIKMHFYTESV